jgi:hypothetical protein
MRPIDPRADRTYLDSVKTAPRSRRLWFALALAVATGLILAGAVLAADDRGRPPARAAAGDALQLTGTVIDRRGLVLPEKWTTINESFAVWDTDGWKGEYAYQIPSSIPPGGAQASLAVRATDKTGGRFAPKLDLTGNIAVVGGPAEATALADKNAGKETDSGTASFTLVPGSYCDTCAVSVTVNIQDGPHITFQYKVVPKAKPCPGGGKAAFAAATGPLICNEDEPGPGQSIIVSSSKIGPKDNKVIVTAGSSAGNLNGTTIVGEGEVKQSKAEKIGEAVAACYLIGVEAFDYPASRIRQALQLLKGDADIDLEQFDRPAQRLKICIALAKELAGPAPALASAKAARGCSTRRIAIVPLIRRGKIVGLKPAKRQRPSRSSVRYGCTGGPGGTATLTVRRRGGLRKAIGKRLDLGVVRAPDAPARQATLTFGFR